MLKTPCHGWHVEHGGRMVDFAGWEMPVQYTTIADEHRAVREAAGLFDIAHMGRIRFSGADACCFLDHLLTNDVTKLSLGQIRYSLVTDEAGGILDDVLVYRFEDFYLLVVNASNREKILGWIERHQAGFNVDVEDLTFTQFMLAIQGPHALEILDPLIAADISAMTYYTGLETTVLAQPAVVTRTGYTGEDGFEVIVAAESGAALWERLIEDGKQGGLLPTGLGCRDTLRLEAAMPLYGHEMDETTDPFTAGLAFGVRLKAGDFIGKAALLASKARTDRPRRVGLELESRRIARQGAQLFAGDRQIGRVTSGTFSPTMQKSIAMGYVEAEFSKAGTQIEVDIRGKRQNVCVVKLPFYSRN